MAIGTVFAALNTMHSAVVTRTVDIIFCAFGFRSVHDLHDVLALGAHWRTHVRRYGGLPHLHSTLAVGCGGRSGFGNC